MVCIGNEFGMYPGKFWPEQYGPDYELTTLLEPLAEHRHDFTLFSHLDHGLSGGHFAVHTFLTGGKAAEARGMTVGDWVAEAIVTVARGAEKAESTNLPAREAPPDLVVMLKTIDTRLQQLEDRENLGFFGRLFGRRSSS